MRGSASFFDRQAAEAAAEEAAEAGSGGNSPSGNQRRGGLAADTLPVGSLRIGYSAACPLFMLFEIMSTLPAMLLAVPPSLCGTSVTVVHLPSHSHL